MKARLLAIRAGAVLVAAVFWSGPMSGEAVAGLDLDVVFEAGDQKMKMDWNAVPTALGYNVRYRRAVPVGTWTGWVDANGRSHTFRNLQNNIPYQFQAKAWTIFGWTTVVSSAYTRVPAKKPRPVRHLQATARGRNVDLTWNAPGTDDPQVGPSGDHITGYEYRQRYRKGSWQSWSSWASTNRGTASEFTASNLRPGTKYGFQIRAANFSRRANETNPATATTMALPGRPTNLTATPGNEAATLSWRAPTSGGPVQYYEFRWRGLDSQGRGRWAPYQGPRSKNTALTVITLKNGSTYEFQVNAYNLSGRGPKSNIARVTLGNVPSAPQLSASAGDGQVTLTWSHPATGQPAKYQKRMATPVGTSNSLLWSKWSDFTAGSVRTKAVTGLPNGVPHSFQVRGISQLGLLGDSSNTATATPLGSAEVRLRLDPGTVTEGSGKSARVYASVFGTTTGPTTVTVQAANGTAETGDYTLGSPATITIPAGSNRVGNRFVTVTPVSDDDAANETVIVSGSVSNATDVLTGPSNVTVTINDDEAPRVVLSVSPGSVTEGSSANSATVTATMDGTTTAATTVTVSAARGTAEAGDFTLSSNTTLTIPAGSGKSSSGTVTITANQDDDKDDETVTVSGTASNASETVRAPSSVTWTIEDDDDNAQPEVTLQVSGPVSEGASATVTAAVSGTTTAATTVTVSAARGTAEADDFTVSSNTTLTIPAGTDQQSSGTVTIAANQDTDTDDETVIVSGTVSNATDNPAVPRNVTLTVNDDDEFVSLSVSPNPVAEGASATVTASIDGTTTAPTTVTVAAAAGTAETADFTVSSNTTLTIPAGTDQQSSGTVTIAANHDDDTDDETVTVSGTATNSSDNPTVPAAVTLAMSDDDAVVTLSVSPDPVTEGSSATVTASIDGTTTAVTTVTVAASAGTAEAGDFTLSQNTKLTIPAGINQQSSGTVAIAANQDADSVDETVTVSGTVSNASDTVTAPVDVGLTIDDDDSAPTVTLLLSPGLVQEGSSSTVTATVKGTTTVATTVTVAASALTAESGDFTLSSNVTLTIPAGTDQSSSGTVTITANQDADSGDETVKVSGSVSNNTDNPTAPEDVTLTINDDEGAPAVVLTVAPEPVSEGSIARVTARIVGTTTVDTTLTVSAAAGTAETGDFLLSTNKSLHIVAGTNKNSTGTVTILANDDDDTADETVTVSATVSNDTDSPTAPEDVTLTIDDDEKRPEVELVFYPGPQINEGTPGNVANVIAHIDGTTTAPTTVTVSAHGGTAEAGDYTLSKEKTLTIPAGRNQSSCSSRSINCSDVTITANQDDDWTSETVIVAGTVSNSVDDPKKPPDLTLTINDDEQYPKVVLRASPNPVSEGLSATVTAGIKGTTTASTTVTVTATKGTAETGDFTLSSNVTLTIPAGTDRTSSGTVTIAANQDDDFDRETVVVSGSATDSDGNTIEVLRTMLTIADDDEEALAIVLSISPNPISEGAASTVTASAVGTAAKPIEVTIVAAEGTGTDPEDFVLSANTTLVIPAGTNRGSTGTVKITSAVDDDWADESVIVTGTARYQTSSGTTGQAAGGAAIAVFAADSAPPSANGAASGDSLSPSGLTLRITDSDQPPAPTVSLTLTPRVVNESGETSVSTVTASITGTTTVATTVTVSAAAGTAEN